MRNLDERAADWIQGGDTGVSSKQIWKVMTGHFLHDESRWDYGELPRDPGDFGRCHRLLMLIPEWIPHLPKMAKAYPTWAPLVREWSRVTELYLIGCARPNRSAWECYNLIHELAVEAGASSGFRPLEQPTTYEVAKPKRLRRRRMGVR